jgi:hypothetical protein
MRDQPRIEMHLMSAPREVYIKGIGVGVSPRRSLYAM